MLELGLALISRSLFFISGYSYSEVEKRSRHKVPDNLKPSGLLTFFNLLMEKGSTRELPQFYPAILHSPIPRSSKLPCFQRRPLEVE